MPSRTDPELLQGFSELPDDAFVTQRTVQAFFSCSSASVWRWVRANKLPAPEKIGERSNRWKVGALRRAHSQRAAAC